MNHSDYKLIPMIEIEDEARELAILWSKNMIDSFITQKHKLASDIMNYAIKYHKNQLKLNTKQNEEKKDSKI